MKTATPADDEWFDKLRSFYSIQGDYDLDEDDSSYRARKDRERREATDQMEKVPGWGTF